MMPDPLHPAVVHLPIALAVLVPGFALAGIFLIFKGLLPARIWAGVVLLQLLLLGSGWLALETGEQEEERVERVVAERYIETHEEAADRFLVVAGIGLLLTAGGLLPGRAGAAGRVAGALASLAVLAAGVAVGHSGGELVYKHGAASAYVAAPTALVTPPTPTAPPRAASR
ncbi:MAG TPA: DUF2231 domain-containing protein [Myxococcota bacterium]|nr:DUF2231 domain-containing protein [Myxococcota bacterium]